MPDVWHLRNYMQRGPEGARPESASPVLAQAPAYTAALMNFHVTGDAKERWTENIQLVIIRRLPWRVSSALQFRLASVGCSLSVVLHGKSQTYMFGPSASAIPRTSYMWIWIPIVRESPAEFPFIWLASARNPTSDMHEPRERGSAWAGWSGGPLTRQCRWDGMSSGGDLRFASGTKTSTSLGSLWRIRTPKQVECDAEGTFYPYSFLGRLRDCLGLGVRDQMLRGHFSLISTASEAISPFFSSLPPVL